MILMHEIACYQVPSYIIDYHVCIILHPHETHEWLRLWSTIKPNQSLKLVLMCRRNHWELLQYFHYLGQGFYHISFLDSISSNTKDERFHHDYTIIFKDFMPYPMYDVLEILWMEIHNLSSKHGHPSKRCLWCLKSKDHIHNCDMNQPDLHLVIIPFNDSYQFIKIFLQRAFTLYPWCLHTDGYKISHTHHMNWIR